MSLYAGPCCRSGYYVWLAVKVQGWRPQWNPHLNLHVNSRRRPAWILDFLDLHLNLKMLSDLYNLSPRYLALGNGIANVRFIILMLALAYWACGFLQKRDRFRASRFSTPSWIGADVLLHSPKQLLANHKDACPWSREFPTSGHWPSIFSRVNVMQTQTSIWWDSSHSIMTAWEPTSR